MGKGKPVDGLDRKCMAYKNCQKCVREAHGDQCIGEFVRYQWKFASKTQTFESANNIGSCERDLFHCDFQFVQDTFAQQGEYNADFNLFYTSIGFDPSDGLSCLPGDGSDYVERVCKGGNEDPWVWTRKNQKEKDPKPAPYNPTSAPYNPKPNKDNKDKPNKNKGKDKYDDDSNDNNNNSNKYGSNNNNNGY